MRSYCSHLLLEWNVLDEFDRDGAVRRMPDDSNIWSDVVLCWIKNPVLPLLGPVCTLRWLVMHAEWGHLDIVQPAHGSGVDSSWSFCSVLVPYRLQRAELWGGGGVILALQALDAVHVGEDNLNVFGHVGRLLDGIEISRPEELENDGDLEALVREMIDHRGEGTACITKVGGHAEEEMAQGVSGSGPCWDDKLMRLLALGVGESNRGLPMLDVTFLVSVGVGIRFWSCIIFHCYLSCGSEQ